MTCATCGLELPADARFCMRCGSPIAPVRSRREERKVVTVLFADLVGFTSRAEQLDPEDVRAFLDPYHARLRTTLERFGGTVEKFIGDAVMAVFGAPVAHEDDPERAVRAALAIRDWVRTEQQDLQLRIGLNTGEALVVLDARPGEGEAMASGDVVNTAARLQTAAPVNGILVGGMTYRATKPVITYRALDEPLRLKGKTDPLPAWEVTDARSRPGAEYRPVGGTFVGRERELRLLVDSLSRIQQDRVAQFVTVVGVPGIGKSRLVAELRLAVEQQLDIVMWRHGRSLPYGDGITFAALAEMTKAQAGILESDTLELAADKLRDAVVAVVPDEDEMRWIETHLRPFVGLSTAQAVRTEQRSEAFNAWGRFFQRLTDVHPLVLAFDDLHWADDNLLDFIDLLVDTCDVAPLLVLCTARPELYERRPAWGGGKRNALTISLAPLTESESARLINQLAGQHVMPVEAQEAVLTRSAGNPLFTEQYMRMLSERSDSGDVRLPETVQGIISARIDTLPDDEKRVLQNAAVIGKVFWPAAVAAVGDQEKHVVETCLRALQRKDFVQRAAHSSVGGEQEYAFVHGLLREVAYNQIPRAPRARKHRSAGDWLRGMGRSEDAAELLAHHYQSAVRLRQAAGDSVDAELATQASASLEEAGIRAQALFANREALRYFEAALELTSPGSIQHGRLLLRIGRVQFVLGDVSGEPFAAAASELLACGDVEGSALAEVAHANVCWQRGERVLADKHIERARTLVSEAPPSETTAQVTSDASRLLMLADADTAIPAAEEALSMARHLGLAELEASSLINLGTARAKAGEQRGIADLELAISLGRSAGAVLETARALNNLSVALMGDGQLQRSLDLLHEVRDLVDRTGHENLARFNRAAIAERLYLLGRWAEALANIDGIMADVHAGRGQYMSAPACALRACIRLSRDMTDAALDDVDLALQLALHAVDPQVVQLVWVDTAYVLIDAAKPDRAVPQIERALGRIRQHGMLFMSEARAVHTLSWSLQALGRGQELVDLLGDSANQNRWGRAATAYAAGRPGESAELCTEMGALGAEAHDRLIHARQLLDAGRRADADRELRRALAFYTSVHATRKVAECETLMSMSA